MSTHDPQSLFRQEVLNARADTASGPPIHIQPVSVRVLTWFAIGMTGVVLAVLVLGSYTRKERVAGVVQATEGVATLTAVEGGLIKRVLVQEGQRVKAGDVIAEIGNERYSDAGNTQSLLARNLEDQRAQLLKQTEGEAEAHRASLAAAAQRMAQARRDLATLQEEIKLQSQQIASSQKLVDQLRPLLAEHIISDMQYEQQRQTLLEQTSRLQALKRQRSATEADLAQAQDEQDKLRGQQRAARAGLDRDLLHLQQEQVQRRGAQLTLIKAPVDGIVSGLQAGAGQSVAAGQLLAAIVPEGSAMEAVLRLPSTAVGFIKPGQAVRVSYDAFPYQRFGQYAGTVRSVSQADVPLSPSATARGDGGDQRAVFLVHVDLARATVHAYGADLPLRPGHTLTADIEIDRRRLIAWMLDPLFAFSGRL